MDLQALLPAETRKVLSLFLHRQLGFTHSLPQSINKKQSDATVAVVL